MNKAVVGSPLVVSHDMMLLAQAQFGAAALAWIAAGTTVQPHAYLQDFVLVAYQQHIGYLPVAICCEPCAVSSAVLVITTNRFPVLLGPYLVGRDCLPNELVILPQETVQELGTAGKYCLVQRANGWIGYLSRSLCGKPGEPSLPRALSWMSMGGGWALINWWSSQSLLVDTRLVPIAVFRVVSLLVLLSVSAAIWYGRRRGPERLYSLGVLAAAGLLLVSYAA